MSFQKTLTASTTAIALALAAAPMTALTAQSVAAQEAGDYSAQELDAFTNALLEVASVREKYTPLLQSAETEDQALNQRIVKRVQAQDKTLQ